MTQPLRAVLSNTSIRPRYPVIGSRWKPGVIERRDTDRGFYEMVNSTCETRAEFMVQRALLNPKGRK